ncbi:holo-ACP synthase [Inhella inkyongensis]|uniref:holo-ACP synthase n=1 Tax=Inhella inkyongensis TaxID=392593 RepID=UPI00110F3C7A|nr:holo-ACP synthase [Inhella inkyongensis]
MIVGLGTDLCSIERMASVWQRQGERFAAKVLGPDELALFNERLARSAPRGMAFLATRFAAKEAFSKAIGLGMRPPMNWQSCQTLPGTQGEPVLHLQGELARWMAERRWLARVSLSDERQFALATVLIQEIAHD